MIRAQNASKLHTETPLSFSQWEGHATTDLHIQVHKVLMQSWDVQLEEVLKSAEVAGEKGVR